MSWNCAMDLSLFGSSLLLLRLHHVSNSRSFTTSDLLVLTSLCKSSFYSSLLLFGSQFLDFFLFGVLLGCLSLLCLLLFLFLFIFGITITNLWFVFLSLFLFGLSWILRSNTWKQGFKFCVFLCLLLLLRKLFLLFWFYNWKKLEICSRSGFKMISSWWDQIMSDSDCFNSFWMKIGVQSIFFLLQGKSKIATIKTKFFIQLSVSHLFYFPIFTLCDLPCLVSSWTGAVSLVSSSSS